MSSHLAHKMFLLWLAAFATGFLLVLARPAHGVSLSWNTFRNAPGWSEAVDLSCTSGSFYDLYMDFAVQDTFADFDMMDITIDVGGFRGRNDPPLPPLPPFWHFEAGGCNENGISTNLGMPADGEHVNPWGFGGGQGQVAVSYAPDFGNDGRGRFLVSIARTSPITLVPGQRYFAMRLVLNTCDADACTGCDSLWGGFAVVAVTIANNQQQRWRSLDPWADADWPLACVNTGGWCGIVDAIDPVRTDGPRTTAVDAAFLPVRQVETLCGPVPTVRRTWGALKIQYH